MAVEGGDSRPNARWSDSRSGSARIAAALATAPYVSLPVTLIILTALLAAGVAYLPWVLAVVALLGCLVDALGPDEDVDSAAEAERPLWLRELPVYAAVPLILAATFFFVQAIAEAAPGELTLFRLACGVLAMGMLYGSAAAVVGHDLIHRIGSPRDISLGQMMTACVLDPGDAVEHVYGHHRTVATPDDPTTARRGEALWAFVPRAIAGAAASAWALEKRRLARRDIPLWNVRNLVLRGVAIQIAVIAFGFLAGGVSGGLAFLAAAALGRFLGEVTKYTSHYGLVRESGQPIAQRHAWNSSGAISAQMMLRAAWHSDHHVHPDKPYWSLDLTSEAPRVHYPAGVVMAIAMLPPLWHRIMRPRLADWDARLATPGELALLGKGLDGR